MEKLHEKTAHELSLLLLKKEISAAELTKNTLARIDGNLPQIDRYITVLHNYAIKKAERIDKARLAGADLSPLAGIPMAIKDNICTEGVKTTCASRMLKDFVPPYNASVVDKLKDSVLIGKTNMDEIAVGSYDGGADAVASGEAVFALGSDTGGSIRRPSSCCSVVSFLPTYGLVSRFGLVAFASSLDRISSVTKDVYDSAMVLCSIAGHDPRDSTSLSETPGRFSNALTGQVKNMRIGMPTQYLGYDISPNMRGAVFKAAKQFEAMGADVRECSLPMTPYALPAHFIISSAEASSNLARYDGVRFGFRASDCDSLDDMYTKTRSDGFGGEVRQRIMIGTLVLGSDYYDKYYKKAQKARTLICEEFDRAFEKYDILLTPAVPCTEQVAGGKSGVPAYAANICTAAASMAGLPTMSLPYGRDKNDIPTGVRLVGKPLGDADTIRAGYALECE